MGKLLIEDHQPRTDLPHNVPLMQLHHHLLFGGGTCEISALGFRLEVFGKNTILINGVPANLAAASGKALFEGLIEQFKINQSDLSIPLKENLARALAKRAGIKAGQKLVKEEMLALITGLFACSTSNYTPDGVPTFFIFELRKIESYFNRQ